VRERDSFTQDARCIVADEFVVRGRQDQRRHVNSVKPVAVVGVQHRDHAGAERCSRGLLQEQPAAHARGPGHLPFLVVWRSQPVGVGAENHLSVEGAAESTKHAHCGLPAGCGDRAGGEPAGQHESSQAVRSPHREREGDVRSERVADEDVADVPWPTMTWPPVADTQLRGQTVVLTPVVPERDAGELFTALDAHAVWRHVAGRPADPDEMAGSLQRGIVSGRLPWLVRLVRPIAGLPTGAVAGVTSYLDVSVSDARLEIGSTSYTPPAWGTSVNPEAKLLLLGHAFDVLGAGRVQLKTDVRNVRSQQAIARLGARYEGTLRRYQRRADGTVRDTVLFSVLAEEWPTVRDALQARLAS
jgi:RimJ/RimL family protein N-acetyltransferase